MVINTFELKQRLLWLIKIRWAGILGVLIVTHVLREVAVLSFSLLPVYSILGLAAALNLAYQYRLHFPQANLEHLSFVQIVMDQIILALAVYFSGGCDSPFIYFFIFHVVISGIILPWRYSFLFAGVAVLLPSVVLGLKHAGILPHYGIFRNEPVIFTDSTVIASYGLAFISTIFLTAYFVTYLSRQLHERNEEVLRLYALSERLRSSIRLQEVISIIEQELRGIVGATTSAYLPINRERRYLTLTGNGQELHIPLVDKNSFTNAVLRGSAMIVDSRLLTSDYEVKALDMIGAKRCMILPIMAAALQPCYEFFQCGDANCSAYQNRDNTRCWELAGTHCKGTLIGNYVDKLALCMECELFTPVGVFLMSLPTEYIPLANSSMEASMRLLEATGMAVSNALLYEKTIQLSKTDGLTGLKNYREFKDALAAEVLRAKRYKRPFSLLLIDVDHFKQYNDSNGHPQGDILLKKIADLLKENFKDTDVVARYGGEEFAIILVETGEKGQAVAIAERLRNMIDWCKFPKQETQPGGKVTVSIGVSCYPQDSDSAEELLKAADEALYTAKKKGRNRVVAAERSAWAETGVDKA